MNTEIILGGNGGMAEVDMLLAERWRVEEKGGPELDSWSGPCF